MFQQIIVLAKLPILGLKLAALRCCSAVSGLPMAT